MSDNAKAPEPQTSIPVARNGNGGDHDEVVRMGVTLVSVAKSVERITETLSAFQLQIIARLVALETQQQEKRSNVATWLTILGLILSLGALAVSIFHK